MAQSLFCDTCGKFISPYYQLYSQNSNEAAKLALIEKRMPCIPDLRRVSQHDGILDTISTLDALAMVFGPMKICCRRMILGSYKKEEIISGTGENLRK